MNYIFVVIIGLILPITGIAAWFTHVYSCIVSHSWGLLISGAIAFPIGIIHGSGIWMGIW